MVDVLSTLFTSQHIKRWRMLRASSTSRSNSDSLPCTQPVPQDKTTSLLDLPESCLVHILQCLPLQQRLGACSMVNSSWRDAAITATCELSCHVQQQQQGNDLVHAVASHPQHITVLQITAASPQPECSVTSAKPWWAMPLVLWQTRAITSPPKGRIMLPGPRVELPALQQLQLEGLDLYLSTVQGHAGWLQGVPALRQLCMVNCTLHPDLQCLTALAGMSALQHLQLAVLRPLTAASLHQEGVIPCRLWHTVSQLTHLDLSAQLYVTDTVLQDIGSLTQLQELLLRACRLSTSGLAALQPLQELRLLRLQDAWHLCFGVKTTPVLMQLPKLQDLGLRGWRKLNPDLLVSMRNLRHLDLEACRTASKADQVSAFLTALSQLTDLLSLRLSSVLWYAGADPHAARLLAAGCASITASSRLQRLALEHCTLPVGGWSHMFQPTRQLPMLQDLVLSGNSPTMNGNSLEHMVQCCPGLRALQLAQALQPDVGIMPLLQLSCLTGLRLDGVAPAAAMGVAMHLTGLRLFVHDDSSCGYTHDELLQLTALKQ